MATREKRAKLQAAMSGVEEPKPDVPDLTDPVVQEDIMNPAGADLELSYTTIRTYPLTMFMSRRVSGLITRVLADMAGAGARNANEAAYRSISVLNSNENLESAVFRFTAVAMHQPGRANELDEQLVPLIRELREKCNASDVVLMYTRLTELSGLKSSPKS